MILLGALGNNSSGSNIGAFASSLVHAVFGAIAFGLECLGPEFTGFGKEGKIRLSEGETDAVGENGKVYEINEKENPALTGAFRGLKLDVTSSFCLVHKV